MVFLVLVINVLRMLRLLMAVEKAIVSKNVLYSKLLRNHLKGMDYDGSTYLPPNFFLM